ncbi:UPF0489 family protein [Pseudomonas savastanoi]|uniref:UPF0489 family protein n=1 Tax=Pseudomonas savastanoi TaxID=29438 RepID=UPI000E3290F0|nr:UPF0489 family protein [Pseudomonas savastanoi]
MHRIQKINIASEIIGGKHVFTFDSHHEALLPWSQCARAQGSAPRLLTLDYHCDTRPAFIAHSTTSKTASIDPDADDGWEGRAAVEVAKIDLSSEETVREAILKLRYDEHISAAAQSNIIDIAFAVVGGPIRTPYKSKEQTAAEAAWKLRDISAPKVAKPKDSKPDTYEIPVDRIVVLPHQKVPTKDHAPSKAYANMALETEFLRGRLDLIEAITQSCGIPGLFEKPYILDIDLDYFNTRKAVQPADHLVFHELIRRAEIITIAREPSCVNTCQRRGEGLTSEWLEAELKRHIREALSTPQSEDDMTTTNQTSA